MFHWTHDAKSSKPQILMKLEMIGAITEELRRKWNGPRLVGSDLVNGYSLVVDPASMKKLDLKRKPFLPPQRSLMIELDVLVLDEPQLPKYFRQTIGRGLKWLCCQGRRASPDFLELNGTCRELKGYSCFKYAKIERCFSHHYR